MRRKNINPDDYIGKKFGTWTILEHIGFKDRTRYFLCICNCGRIKEKSLVDIELGRTTTCKSCMQRIHGDGYRGRKTPEYNAWVCMKTRCYNPNTNQYRYYGARGIKVCERWLDSYQNFLADMGRRPGPEYSLDRIDNNGNYSPENCRWATNSEQNSNKTNNIIISVNNITSTLAWWSEYLGVNRSTIFSRVKRYNCSYEEAVLYYIEKRKNNLVEND